MEEQHFDDQLEQFEQGELTHHDMMALFDEMTFREKWRRVAAGLKQQPETGEYKFAKLQILRLLSPISAVLVPVVIFLLIAFFASFTQPPTRNFTAKVIEPEPPEELEDIEEPEIEPPEPPDPVEVEFESEHIVEPSEVVAPPVEFSPQPAEFDSVAITKSPVIMKNIYGSRSPGARGQAVAAYGGSKAGQAAVLRALRWFKVNQASEGYWGANKVAMTSLVLLAYLAHGDTPSSEEFGLTVEKAIHYIVEQQNENGTFKGGDGHEYTTPIAAYALSEAFALTKVPPVKYAAEKSIRRVIKGQNAHGGFNYGLKGSADTRNDLSYIAWCVQSLKAAKMAGLDVEGLYECMKKAVAGTKKNYGGGDGYGGFSYSNAGVGGLTGAGTLCLQFLGHANDNEVQSALATLDKSVFTWNKAEMYVKDSKDPIYYWYYTTQAKFQAGGAHWQAWNKQFSPVLVQNQDIIPAEASGYTWKGKARSLGTWMPPPDTNMHGGNNNPVFSTVLCTLMLEVYYRYLPTFKESEIIEEKETLDDDDDIEINIVGTKASIANG